MSFVYVVVVGGAKGRSCIERAVVFMVIGQGHGPSASLPPGLYHVISDMHACGLCLISPHCRMGPKGKCLDM